MYSNKSLSEAIRERLFSEGNHDVSIREQQSQISGATRYAEWTNSKDIEQQAKLNLNDSKEP